MGSGTTRILTCERQDGTPLEDDLLTAVQQAGLDLTEQDSVLNDFLNVGDLDRLNWTNPAVEVFTRAWGYPIHITPESIHIHTPAAIPFLPKQYHLPWFEEM